MMHLLSWGWFLLRLALFPLRLVLYVLHGLFIFLSKPGARILVPAGAAIALWGFWQPAAAAADPWVKAILPVIQPLLGYELYWSLYPYRLLFPTAVAFSAGILLLSLLAEGLRPILGALPAPAKPLLPHPPFRTPRRKVKTVPVTVAVRPLPKGGLEGNWRALTRRMPPDVQALLERDPQPAGRYPGPAEITATRPLWPPLGLEPVSDEGRGAPAPAKGPGRAPEPAGEDHPASAFNAAPTGKPRAKAQRTASSPVRKGSRAAQAKGSPPLPPPPARQRTQAAE